MQRAPSAWITRYAHLVPPGVRVLDVAAGSGRHALFFAARGNRVVAVDRDQAALAAYTDAPRIETRTVDLEGGVWPFPDETFDAIVVVNYLHRATLPHLLATLASDGTLLYETFAAGNEAYGRPSNPDFLLRPGELLDAVRDRLTVVAFEQGLSPNRDSPAVIERIAAVGPARAWPPALLP
jgi:SAM-dependent methyltransferase